MKHAFTLIEIMVVIFIILIFAVIGTGAYSAVRQRLIPDIETDKVIAMLNSLRSTARSSGMCEGLIFTKNAPMQRTESAYVNPSQPCAEPTTKIATPFTQSVALSAITIDNTSRDTIQVQFIPPQGSLDFALQQGETGAQAVLTIASANAPENFKTVVINKLSGVIEKK